MKKTMRTLLTLTTAISMAAILMATLLLTGCGLQVSRPEIKKGSFDFTVTYQYGGETKTVSGVYVCEYQGTDWALDGGYHRTWNARLEGDGEELIQIGTTEDGSIVELALGLYPEYFMGDTEGAWMGAPQPRLIVSHKNGEEVSVENDAFVIEDTYGAKIVSYEYAQPIENSFGLFK
jgi:hypothetical protein